MPSKNPPVGPNPQQGNVEDPNAQPAGGRPTTTILPGPVAPGPTTTIIPPVGGVSSVVLPSSSSAGTGGDTAPPVTNLTGVGAPPTGNYKAPHWVMYTDCELDSRFERFFASVCANADSVIFAQRFENISLGRAAEGSQPFHLVLLGD